ncbi:ABC transporter ATP-binding protein [Halobacteriales archaeon QH_7_65_31]|nr:MAG: ABC transporter ATP-binding protein [Halobacteriales archaeon QH_7_65_31]
MSNEIQQFRQPATDSSPRFEQDTRTDERQTGDAVLRLQNVTKRFGGATAVSGLDLTVRDGELLTLLGPSGCGKTTTLRMIAGLESPSEGRIRVGDTTVAGIDGFTSPENRDVGLVFQEFALFPHLTVAENIAFGLDGSDTERVEMLLDLVGLTGYGDRSPTDLSGGERQRVALARSLAPEPDVLLLDEPFSNLDVRLRVEMREEVRRILKETGVTAVSVTHDQEEAMSISDRVAVMYDGQLEQVDTPERVFQQPRSRFVASFLGHASFVSGRVDGDTVESGLGPISRASVDGLATQYDGTRVDVMLRPDDVVARPAREAEANGRAVHRRFLGPTVLYRVELDSGDTVGCMHNHDTEIPLNEPLRVELDVGHDLAWFPSDADRTADSE